MITFWNFASRGASFVFFTLLAYLNKDANIAAVLVSATSAVGLAVTILGPINLHLIRQGRPVLNFVTGLLLCTVSVIAIVYSRWTLDPAAVIFCLSLVYVLNRALTDYHFVIANLIIPRNIVTCLIFLCGVILTLTSFSVVFILSSVVLIDIVAQFVLIKVRRGNIIPSDASLNSSSVFSNMLFKCDHLLLLYLAANVTPNEGILLLHFTQLITVISTYRLRFWFEFLQKLSTESFVIVERKFLKLVLLCLVFNASSLVGFAILTDHVFWMSLCAIIFHRLAFQDSNVLSLYLDFRLVTVVPPVLVFSILFYVSWNSMYAPVIFATCSCLICISILLKRRLSYA